MLKKNIALSLCGLFFLIFSLPVFSLFAQNESLTITTYYPSPYGSYNEMRAKKAAIGDNYIASGTYPIPANTSLIVETNVGIGTAAPGALLQVGQAVGGSGAGTAERIRIGGKQFQYWRIESTDSGTQAGLGLGYSNLNPAIFIRTTGVADADQVGIGTTAPSVKLETAANTAIKVGQTAYLSSGGTDLAHFANNEWFNGSAWQTNGRSGGLLQINGQNFLFYRHNGAGTHTSSLSIDGSGNMAVAGNLKVVNHYFDANDDGWLRLKDADNGNYKDFAAGNMWAAGNMNVNGNLAVSGAYQGITCTVTRTNCDDFPVSGCDALVNCSGNKVMIGAQSWGCGIGGHAVRIQCCDLQINCS